MCLKFMRTIDGKHISGGLRCTNEECNYTWFSKAETAVVDCRLCKNMEKTGKSYMCNHKHVNMGFKVYYQDQEAYVKTSDGDVLCDFKRKKKIVTLDGLT